MKNVLKNSQKGFTLITLIIYVVLLMIVLVSILTIGQNLIFANVKARNQREVSMNARLAMNQIVQKIRGADNVTTGSSTFNVHPGVLTLDYPGAGTDVIFDTYTKNITVNGITITIRKLRMKDGAAAYQDLTNDQVNVTNFVLRNLTRSSEAKNINLELTIQQINPGNNPDYNTSISLETAVAERK